LGFDLWDRRSSETNVVGGGGVNNDITEIEGSGATQLVQLMKMLGYNKDVDFLLGTITSPPPSIKVKLDKMAVELEKDDVIILQHITNYSVPFTASITKAKYESAPSGTLDEQYVDTSGQYAAQKQSYKSLNFTFDEGTITLKNALKTGDRVIVAEIDNGQKYVILDRAVSY
jgi:hypothetical protein